MSTGAAGAAGGVAYEAYDTPIALIQRQGYFDVRGMTLDDAHTKHLAGRIRDVGALDPILVWPDGSGFTLLDGAHRLEAYRLAGWDRVPALIVHCDRHAALLVAIEANAKAALVLSNSQRWDLAWRLVLEPRRGDKFAYSRSQITKATGTAKGTVDNMRARRAAFERSREEPTGNWLRDRLPGTGLDWSGMDDEEIERRKRDLVKQLRKTLNVRGFRNDQFLAEALQLAVGERTLRGWMDYLFPNEEFDGDGQEDHGGRCDEDETDF